MGTLDTQTSPPLQRQILLGFQGQVVLRRVWKILGDRTSGTDGPAASVLSPGGVGAAQEARERGLGRSANAKNQGMGGSPGVLVPGRTLKCVWRWRCDTCAMGAAARKGTVNKAIHLAGVCSVDFLSQKLFLCVRLT